MYYQILMLLEFSFQWTEYQILQAEYADIRLNNSLDVLNGEFNFYEPNRAFGQRIISKW